MSNGGNNSGVWKFLCAFLGAVVLSFITFWVTTGNKLHACQDALTMREQMYTELGEHRQALRANTEALKTMTILLNAHGITLDSLTVKGGKTED